MAALIRRLAPTAVVLCASWALGALFCLVKGEGGGLAMAVGNLVAPYFIVAVGAGLTSRHRWTAALLGVVATETMVAGFYGTWAGYFDHEVSLAAVRLWGGAGVGSGLLFGAVGNAARSRSALRYIFPALLFLEPGVTQLALLISSRFGIGYPPHLDPGAFVAYAIEVAVGIVLLLAVRWHLHVQRRRSGEVSASAGRMRPGLPRTTV